MGAREMMRAAYYRAMAPLWARQFSFAPRLIDTGLGFRFFVGNEQGAEWYDGLKEHARVEFEWVRDNVKLEGQRVLDVGAHHGMYTLFLAHGGASKVVAVEPHPANCGIIGVNVAVNGYEDRVEIREAAVAAEVGRATFLPRGNGKLYPGAGITVTTLTIGNLGPADVVKLDIEGGEFDVLPQQIDGVGAHTWIVEFHPKYGDVSKIRHAFAARGFTAHLIPHTKSATTVFKRS